MWNFSRPKIGARLACAMVAASVAVVGTPGPWSEAAAQETAAPETSSPQRTDPVGTPAGDVTAEDPADLISSAVKVTLRLRDYPDLTGDYRVNADGTISIPVIGRIPVDGMRSADLEQVLAERVTEITGSQSYATVEIAEYKPVFVTGHVKLSGSSQWQPGMTVLQAIAVSGGIAPPTPPLGLVPTDPGRLAKALDDRKRLLAALARITGEKNGVDAIEMPEELVALAGPEEADRLLTAQDTLMQSRRQTLAAELAVLERGKTLAAEELEGLKEQSGGIAEQLELRRENAKRIQELQARGLAIAERALEQDLKVLELEEKATNISVAVARVQAFIAGLDRDAVALQQNREAEIESEALRLERDLSQITLEAQAARLSDATYLAGALGANQGPTILQYSITRNEGGQATVIDAEEGTLLLPGDILVVATTQD